MSSKNNYFTPSTNLKDDVNNDYLLKNIVITNQVLSTVKLFSDTRHSANNSALSIVGPYGSGKSTTALFLYHYLTNSLTDVVFPVIQTTPFNSATYFLLLIPLP